MLLAQIWLFAVAISSQEAGLDDQRLVTGLLANISSKILPPFNCVYN